MNVNQVVTLVPQVAGMGKKGAIEKTLRETNESFGATLAKAVTDVNALQTQAGNAVQSLVRGDSVDLHQVMVAVEKAKTSFELLMEIRNKTVSAYQELMRLQV
jgi:flagellar hook-basal body complex protein FliE